MKRLLCAFLTLLLAASVLQAAQHTNSSTVARKAAVKRGPVFRANKEQIKQAQVTWNINAV